MSKIESQTYISNPFNEKPSTEKLEEMKAHQEKTRESLFLKLEEQRLIYKEQKTMMLEARSVFEKQRSLANKNENNENIVREFEQARYNYSEKSFSADNALSILQFRTNNYTRACRINLIDLA